MATATITVTDAWTLLSNGPCYVNNETYTDIQVQSSPSLPTVEQGLILGQNQRHSDVNYCLADAFYARTLETGKTAKVSVMS